MFCNKCGVENKSDTKFCKECGLSIGQTELIYAGFWIRFGAYFADYLCFIFLVFVLGILLGLMGLFNYNNISSTADYLITITLLIAYNTLFVTLWSTTPGKKLYGLKILLEDGNKLNFVLSLKRALIQPLSFILFGAGFWNMNENNKKQAWHDKKVRTIVVREQENNYILPIFISILGVLVYLYMKYLVK